MKVIGAGLPRTATLSQKLGLEILGFEPCYHMVNVLGDLGEGARWRRVLDGDLRVGEVFDGFQATVDWPGSFFYDELLEDHPDAKVLLSVRSPDAWAESMRDTIWAMFYDDVLMRHLSDARACVDPQWREYTEMMKEMWQRSGLLNGEATTLEWMAAGFERYVAQVRRRVPADQLLVWSPADGWEPLCDFLERPVPDMPFPRVNDTEQFAQRIVDGALIAVQEHSSLERDRAPVGD